MSSRRDTLSIEKQSLEAHVDLCAERYKGLREDISDMSCRIEKLESDMNKKMDKLETIIVKIDDRLTDKETSALRGVITFGLGLITLLVSALGGLAYYILTAK